VLEVDWRWVLRGAVDVEGWAGQHVGLTRMGRGTYLEKGVYLSVMCLDNGAERYRRFRSARWSVCYLVDMLKAAYFVECRFTCRCDKTRVQEGAVL